jgi:hypothetical protein
LQRTQSPGFLEDCSGGVDEVKVLPLQPGLFSDSLGFRLWRGALYANFKHASLSFSHCRCDSNLPFVDGTRLERAIAGLVTYDTI